MRHDEQLDLFFVEIGREAFRRWQRREDAKEAAEVVAHNKLLIESGDPEMEQVISALEQGWLEGR